MKKFIGGLLVLTLIAMPTSALAEDEKISMDFVNVDIAVVVKYISELTGKNFVIDEKVQGKVTIISPKKVSREEAYRVFESIMEVYGFVAIPSGNIVKIVPLAEARQKPGMVRVRPDLVKDTRDHMVTRLISLKSISAENIISIIRPLIPSTSYIAAYAPSNTLILVDMASNHQRILEIIKQLDVKGVESFITVHRLKYASAKDLASKITTVLGKKRTAKGKKGGGVSFNVIADERINALVIVGNDFYVSKVRSLIEQLDIEAPPGRQEINVIYLKNANAEELAKVINQLAIGIGKTRSGRVAGAAAKMSARKNKITVTADNATNSLLITSAPEDFVALQKVIDKLDRPRKQVFVEALIFEISMDDTKKFGVEWRATGDFNNEGLQGIGGTNFGGINQIAANPLSSPSGLVLGVVDGTITYGGQTFLNIGGLVQALQMDSKVNILSTPNILTTNNEEAEIFVGENVPFVKSTAQTTGATPIVSIERLDIGVILRIKPQINESEIVRLEIYQEISNIRAAPVGVEASDIITSKRSTKTVVTVKNHQNIIIGGLIRNDKQVSIQKVPILGDIPILGWLFKSREEKNVKTNLLIFITPHIINSSEDLQRITYDKGKFMRKLQGKERPDTRLMKTPMEQLMEEPEADVKKEQREETKPDIKNTEPVEEEAGPTEKIEKPPAGVEARPPASPEAATAKEVTIYGNAERY